MAIKNTHNTIKISSVDHEEQSPIITQKQLYRPSNLRG